MRFEATCIESIAAVLPEEVWTSAQIEERLAPLYERLKLPFGRLELMTGIRARRVWPRGTRPSAASAAAGTFAKLAQAVRTASSASAASLRKDGRKNASAASATTATVAKPAARSLAATSAAAGSVKRVATWTRSTTAGAGIPDAFRQTRSACAGAGGRWRESAGASRAAGGVGVPAGTRDTLCPHFAATRNLLRSLLRKG